MIEYDILSEWQGAFKRYFTVNLAPHCRVFSRALQTEKLNALLFPGHVEAGTTYDWRITFTIYSSRMSNFNIRPRL